MFRAGAFALATALVSFAGTATTLADAMKGDAMKGGPMMIDCKNADATMMKMAHSDDAMMPAKMSGNADQDFAKMAMVHQNEMVAMARVEAKCGKSAQARAEAQKMIDRLNQIQADLQLILHTP
jgi:uncharacterized protein (DUF305 family)